MPSLPWSKELLVGLGLLMVLVACSSSPGADGDSCSTNGACSSGRCSNGSCDGTDCKCETPDCHSRASCDAGWLCTRGEATSNEVVPRCRQECSATVACPSSKHCDNGVCQTGPAPFVLAWTSFPRTSPCAANVPCSYAVTVSAGTTVSSFTWTFGDAPPVDTKEPSTMFTYPLTGTFRVSVRATAKSGAVAKLEQTEILCVGGPGTGCDPAGAPCCGSSCNVKGLCQ